MYLVKSFLYILLQIYTKVYFLASAVKYLNSFLPKETLLERAILLIAIFFIEIGALCWGNFNGGLQYHQIL